MPSSRLHKAEVLSNKMTGRGCYRLVLRAPDAAKRAAPGQFVMLRVSEGLDPLLARPFGISSIVSRTSIEIFYRVAGRGTMLLTAVEPGRSLIMQGPLGSGFTTPGKGVTPVLVAGGSGFPPLLYFAHQIRSTAHIFTGARSKDGLPPPEALKRFRRLAKKLYIATEDGSTGKRGLVTDMLASFLKEKAGGDRMAIYACGPRPMLAEAARLAREFSIPCRVSMEERMACGIGACMGCSVRVIAGGYKRVCKEGPVFDAAEIDWRME